MRESDVGCVQVPDSLFQQIRQQPGLLARLGSFVEVNIEFLCSEPLVFSVAMPEAFADLGPNMLSPESMQQAPMEIQAAERQCVMRIANRLLSVCLSIGEFPAIRYQRGPTSSSKVASQLNDLIKPLESTYNFATPAAGSSTLLILDRTHDPLSPLLHDLHGQVCPCDPRFVFVSIGS
jgi:hypothetical protein